MRRLSLSLVLVGSLMSNVWANEPAAPPVASTYNIGYLTLDDAVDKRYSDKTLFAKYLGQSLGRPEAGAETALKEVK